MESQSLPEIQTLFLPSSSGRLELLTCLPPAAAAATSENATPLFFLHGAHCAAACYKIWLPLFAAKGYPSYALSLRGHGASWKPAWYSSAFFTTLKHVGEDIALALTHIREQHQSRTGGTTDASDVPVVVFGHSLGGGMLQYLLSAGRIRAAGLVLIAAAPLSGGGKELSANIERTEAPNGYARPWSKRFVMESVEQTRKLLFSPETEEEVIEGWLRESKSEQGLRIGITVFWPYGTAEKVLAALDGLPGNRQKKVLCISTKEDVLITPQRVKANADAYRAAGSGSGRDHVEELELSRGGHHIMLDIAREDGVEGVVKWLTT